jgi:pimeloyl-ACP methyl ester carboxylesterase
MLQLLISMMVAALGGDAERTHVRDDVYHHEFTLRLGDTPNARIRMHRVVRERAPWIARPTHAGAMFLHGDFSTFEGNFGGMAPWLAERGIDVWGFDRRWAFAPADADVADFADMGFAQEIDDTGQALAAARTLRAFTGSGVDRMHLVGFSRGGFLAYAAAAADGARPAPLRQVKGLVPLDVWAEIPPEDTAARDFVCISAHYERLDLAAGVVDSPNGFFIALGGLVQTAPDEPTPFPFLAGFTNRQAFLFVAAQTYAFFTPTPHYHLAAADLDETGTPLGLSESSETAIAQWFAGAAPHQSLREAADTDGIWCGDGQGPFTVDLSLIRVPVHYVGAAGGYGDRGLYSLTRVSSTDVSSNIVQRFGSEGAFEDFGHGDLLFADDAPALAWQPLASWLASH